jgi:hypothetical protein
MFAAGECPLSEEDRTTFAHFEVYRIRPEPVIRGTQLVFVDQRQGKAKD